MSGLDPRVECAVAAAFEAITSPSPRQRVLVELALKLAREVDARAVVDDALARELRMTLRDMLGAEGGARGRDPLDELSAPLRDGEGA